MTDPIMTDPALPAMTTDPPGLRLWQDTSAAVTTEYAILAALLAVMSIAGILAFGDGIDSLWSAVGSEVGSALAVP